MAAKKVKALKTADKIQDFGQRHKESLEYIHNVLLLKGIRGLDQTKMIAQRAKILPGAPAKFYAEYDGTKFCFRLGFGSSSTKLDIDTVDVSKLGPATADLVKVQLKKCDLI